MHTPSLRRRVMLSGVLVFALLVVLLDVFVYVILQRQLEGTLAEVLDTRADLVRELGSQLPAEELVDRLTSLGVPVRLTTPDGAVREGEPAVSRFGDGPPGPLSTLPAPRVSTAVQLADGGVVEVFASRAGVRATLARTATLLTTGTVVAVIVAALLFRRTAAMVVAPLDEMVAAAGRTAEGRTGERLRPDDPDTELGRLATAYDAMLDALEEALSTAHRAEERTRQFVDDAAHQMRTPIATLRSCVESLLRTSDPEIRDELFGYIVRETARSQRLVNDLLTTARMDQGHHLHLEVRDLVAICSDEVERVRSRSPGLIFESSAQDAPVHAPVDEDAIREVLANLLDNARRHADARVDVAVVVRAEMVTVTVADDGPGVPAGAADRMFERFTTLDGRGGSGLGLSIARQLTRAHGGDLTYVGGAFELDLPRHDGTIDGPTETSV